MSDRKLASYFTTVERVTPNTRLQVWCLTDAAPQWLRDAVYAAHYDGKDLPNDWIYSEVRDVCLAIDDEQFDANEDYRQDHGQIHEYADAAVDIYTRGLYQWQADMCQTDTYAYAEERLADMGSDDAKGEKRVAMLQYCAIEYIAETVVNAWAESLDADDDQEENDE
jgi:hypothetical protein